MKPIPDGYILSTGKEIHANCRILGLNDGDERWPLGSCLHDGYDGFRDVSGGGTSYVLTKEERKEISEYMINLWKLWGEYQ